MSGELSGREPARAARGLLRRCDRAALATNFGGAPYASLALVAADHNAAPLLLLSDLAQHSRNIAFEPRVSLLFDGTAGHADPLTGPRLSVLGQAVADDEPRLLARFVARHPTAAVYAGFADFRLYRVAVERGHVVAGFGRIDWIAGADLLYAGACADLAEAEAAILRHMNADHRDAILHYARLLGRDGSDWVMTGIDPEGFDLRHDCETARLDFPAPIETAADARKALIGLASATQAPTKL
jgi:putative heme iron utilization protein